jgi:hypothetical protein
MCWKLICLVSFVLAFGLVLSSNALAGATQFDFGGDLSATFGAGTLGYYNGARTSNTVSFGTASSFGLPALPGGDDAELSAECFQVLTTKQADDGLGFALGREPARWAKL